MKSAFLCVDIGTSSLKLAVFDEAGLVQHHRRVSYENLSYSNTDITVWEFALERAMSEIPESYFYKAFCVSGHGPSIIPVGKFGEPVGPVSDWTKDSNVTDFDSFFIPKILCYKTEHPEIYSRTVFFMSPAEFLSYRLGAAPVFFSPYLEFNKYLYSESELESVGISLKKIPRIAYAGTVIGQTKKILGLPSGIPIVAGLSDFQAALIGGGIHSKGKVCDRAGTSEGINLCWDKPLNHNSLRNLPHPMPDFFNVSRILSSTGLMFHWLRNIAGLNELPYSLLFAKLSAFKPHKNRPIFIPALETADLGSFRNAVFLNLNSDSEAMDLAFAVLEAVGVSLLDVFEIFTTESISITEMLISGGQCQSDEWNQMKANILGIQLVKPSILDLELLGTLNIALCALGDVPSWQEASEKTLIIQRTFQPDRHSHEQFQQLQHSYNLTVKQFLN